MLSGKASNAKPGPRIRPPRRQPMTGTVSEFDSLWTMLRGSFCDIHNRDASALAFEQLYRASYKIVLKKKGAQLWENVTDFETGWFADKVMPVINTLITSKIVNVALAEISDIGATERRELGGKFLKGLKDAWEEHQTAMNMITDILMYMDRTMVADARKPSIFTSSIGLYRDNVLLAHRGGYNPTHRVCDLVNAVIVDMVNMERRGDTIDRSLVRSVCSMLEQLHETNEEKENERLYLTIFDPCYIEESRKFYAAECQRMLQEQDCSAWLRHAEKRLDEEEDRCKTTLSIRSSGRITKVVEQELIIKHLDDFLSLDETGLRAMIDNDRREDLSILYRLLLRVDKKLPQLKAAISKRVVEAGLDIEKAVSAINFSTVSNQKDGGGGEGHAPAVSAPSKPASAAAQATAFALKWVDDVLALRKRFRTTLEVCFANDSIIESALAKSFADFVNMFSRASEFISLYIDEHMKKGSRGGENVEPILEEAIVLINHIQERDLFERYYQKHLARRLLHGRSESTELEQWFINAMKQQVGTHFTAKFEGMFKDMSVSADLRRNYKEHISGLADDDGGYKKVDLAINVLTSNNWPADSMGRSHGDGDGNDIIYPDDIQKLQESFRKYYSNGRNGRVLSWVPSVGSAEIKCVFPKVKETGPLSKERRYELTVTTFGMVVVMLFNNIPNDQWMTFEEIKEQTNIPVGDLQRTLAGITIPPKSRILLKEPNTKTIKITDKFCFNASFVSRSIKVKVPTVPGSRVESKEERQKTEDKNNETRANACSAALVRIMKQRKELSHTLLVNEVMSLLSSRFCPEISAIKQQIDVLMTKEYIERVDIDNAPGYRYLA